MRKKFLVLILSVLATVCLSLFAGCSIFGEGLFGGDGGDGNQGGTTPPSNTDDPILEAPDHVRLDMGTYTLYVPDGSESGVTYYVINQIYGSSIWKVCGFSTEGRQAEDGYFAIDVINISENYSSFDLEVVCKANWNDAQEVSNTFTFTSGGGITYDTEHCTFDEDSGLFTWAKVTDATGYRVDMYSNNFIVGKAVVNAAQVTVPADVTGLNVVPLFDVYKIGTPVRINLEATSPQISYNQTDDKFTWQECGDSYKLEITENGTTTAHNLTGNEFVFAPSCDSVTVKLTAFTPLHYSGAVQVTYDVLQSVSGVALDKYTRKLSWSAISGFTQYKVRIEADGKDPVDNFVTGTNFTLQDLTAGVMTVKIKPVDSSKPSLMTMYSESSVRVLPQPKRIMPSYNYDDKTGAVNISFAPDADTVECYNVQLTSDSGQNNYTIDPTESDTVSVQMSLAPYELGQISVTRTYKDFDELFCYNYFVEYADIDTKMMFLPAPKVELVNTPTFVNSKLAFKIRIKYPVELAGKGSLSLNYSYNTISQTEIISADKEVTYNLATASTLTVRYSSYKIGSDSVRLITQNFEETVRYLDNVNTSAGAQKITWNEVDGATDYVVEELVDGDYNEVYRGPLTQYTHGVSIAGEYSYRVFAVSDNPFLFDGEADGCKVCKLEKPTVNLTEYGEIKVTPPDNTASVIALLNGTAKELSIENLRAALSSGTSATLTARSVKESTQKLFFIDSDETNPYTLHRIGDVSESSLNISVNSTLNTVSFAPLQGADEYACKLVRFSIVVKSFAGSERELSGSGLEYGQYELQVKPISRSQGENFYIYLGDYISGYFQKDGIRSATLLEDGSGFALDSAFYSPDAVASWKARALYDSTYYTFDKGESVRLTDNQALIKDFTDMTSDNSGIYFGVNYSSDEALNQSKTLKADEFRVVFNLKQSAAKSGFRGSYSYVDRTDDPTAQAQAKVTLTPESGEVLNAVERYTVVYKQKELRADNSTATFISETLGNELYIPVGNERITRMFYLGIESNRFAKVGNELSFYMSSTEKQYTDDNWYELTLQAMYEATLTANTATKLSDGKVKITFNLSFENHTPAGNNESFYLEYLADDGTWQALYINGNIYTLVSGNSSFDLEFTQPNNLTVFPGSTIQIRIKSGNCSYSLSYLLESDWTYLTLTVPRY